MLYIYVYINVTYSTFNTFNTFNIFIVHALYLEKVDAIWTRIWRIERIVDWKVKSEAKFELILIFIKLFSPIDV